MQWKLFIVLCGHLTSYLFIHFLSYQFTCCSYYYCRVTVLLHSYRHNALKSPCHPGRAVIQAQHKLPPESQLRNFIFRILFDLFDSSCIEVIKVRTLSVNMLVLQEALIYAGSSLVCHSCDSTQIVLTRKLKPSQWL